MIRQKLPLPVIDSTDGKLLVWVGGLDSWDPLLRDCCLGVPRFESQTIAGKPQIYHEIDQMLVYRRNPI